MLLTYLHPGDLSIPQLIFVFILFIVIPGLILALIVRAVEKYVQRRKKMRGRKSRGWMK
jgi:hypothetical protein